MGKYYCYVVWVGRRPGIYFSWDECLAEVHGFPGARFKGFYSLEEAEAAFWNQVRQDCHMPSTSSNLNTRHDVPLHGHGRGRQEGPMMTYIFIGLLLVVILLLGFMVVARRRLLLSILLEEEEMFDAVIQSVCEEMDTPPRIPRRMMNTSEYTGEMWVNSILTGHEKRCYTVFRLHPHVFTTLRDLLVNKSLIGDSRDVSASQQLAMFLYAVGHGAPTGVLVEHFQHSSQTISHYVNKLAIALASLKDDYILQPTHTNEIHPHIAGNERFYPFFKNAIGAIDGTHIPANLPIEDHPRFRNRKQQITQNVMAVVSFDGLFVYACVGWEGSAPDMKVLRWAVSREELVVPTGKYYLVDEGYANTDAFIAPYRGVRYHISSFRRRGSTPYENKKDKFNHRHAQLRNCVERAFGVLKMRFQTLREGNMYPFSTQKKIVFACLVIHNFVRLEHGYDDFFNQPLDEHSSADDAGDDEVPIAMKLDATAVAAGHAVREAIADELWAVGNV